MIIVPKSGSSTGRIAIGQGSDGGFEAGSYTPWAQHVTESKMLNSLFRDTYGAGIVMTSGDNGCQGPSVQGGYQGQCGDLIGPKESIRAVMGNHDGTDMGGIAAFLSYFGYGNQYYTWTYGNIQGFGLYEYNDAGTELASGSAQYLWLSQSIRDSYSNPAIKWRIVHSHAIVQCSTTNHPPNAALQAVPWQKWGVNVIIHGHNHTIERLESGSVAIYIAGGVSNQKTGYQYTGTSVFSKYIHTDAIGTYPYSQGYNGLLLEAIGDNLNICFYSSSGAKVPDTGSTSIPGATFANNTLTLTSLVGGQPPGEQTFSIVSNEFVETGSWESGSSGGGSGGGQQTSSIILPRNSYWNVWSSNTPPSTFNSNTGSTWPSASFTWSGSLWTSSLQAPMRNQALLTSSKPPPTGWEYNYADLASPQNSGISTHYFVTTWSFNGNPSQHRFTASYITDDGCAVWINEKLAWIKLIQNEWSFNTLTAITIDATGSWTEYPTASLFVSGTNQIAVEVHQTNAASTDVAWGLEIVATSGSPAPAEPPAEEPTGSGVITASLILPRGSGGWIYYDKFGDPSTGSYQYVSGSWYAARSASNWVSGSNAFHNASEATIPANWTYNTTVAYTTNVGPFTHLAATFFTLSAVYADDEFVFQYFYDDGLYVYINGQYAINGGMPAFAYNYARFASANVEPNTQYSATISSSYFRTGSNTIVVEIHNNNSASSDVAWGIELARTSSGDSTAPTGSQTGSSAVGLPTLKLITGGDPWVYWDQLDDPSSGSQAYVSASWYTEYGGPASSSNWKVGSGSFHTSAEVGVPNTSWTYQTDLNFTASVGPFTHIFSKLFEIPSASASDTFRVRHINDDGLYIFINGARCFSNNQTMSTWRYGESSSATLEPTTEYTTTISPSFFTIGTNLMVVQVHQVNPVTTDVVFGLTLDWTGSATGSPVYATTGSKFRFSQGGVLKCLAGPLYEYLPTNPYGSSTLVARMSSSGYFYADELSEIPIYDDMFYRVDGGDSYCYERAYLWKNQMENAANLSMKVQNRTAESSSYLLTNSTNGSILNSQFGTASALQHNVLNPGTASWSAECVVKLTNTCSFTRGYLIGLATERIDNQPIVGLLSNLSAHWDFEEPSGIRYSHDSQSNFIYNQALVNQVGKLGNSVRFTSSAGSMLEGQRNNDAASIASGESWTVGYWVYLKENTYPNGYWDLIFKGDDYSWPAVRSYGNYHNANNWNVYIGNGVTDLNIAIPTTFDAWQYLIQWYDAAANIFYCQKDNGTIYSGSFDQGTYTNTSSLKLGAGGGAGAPSGSEAFASGSIDSLDVWKRVLTPTERAWLYNSGSGLQYDYYATGPSAGLLNSLSAHWNLDETTGIRYSHDSQSNFIYNQSFTGSEAGIYGNAAKFPARDSQSLSCPDNSNISIGVSQSFAIGLWIKQGGTSSVQNILIKGINDGTTTFREYNLTRQNAVWSWGIHNGVGGLTSMTYPVTASVWQYHLMEYDHSTKSASLFVNNVQVVTTQSFGSYNNNTGSLTISGRPTSGSVGFYFTGSMDNISIWKRTLTPTEKNWLWNSGSGLQYTDYENGPDYPLTHRVNGFYTTPDNVLNVTYFWHTGSGTTYTESRVILPITLSLNQWYHLSMTYDSGSTSSFFTYVNGITMTSSSFLPGQYYFDQPSTFFIGGSPVVSSSLLDYCSNGYFAIVGLHTRSLSQREVRASSLYYNKQYNLGL